MALSHIERLLLFGLGVEYQKAYSWDGPHYHSILLVLNSESW
uniref:Uncharacterized protein n=1 Tax=Rhizophora mucronata TaxID=61149 RepID=A0A2P2M8N9_RHIMU